MRYREFPFVARQLAARLPQTAMRRSLPIRVWFDSESRVLRPRSEAGQHETEEGFQAHNVLEKSEEPSMHLSSQTELQDLGAQTAN